MGNGREAKLTGSARRLMAWPYAIDRTQCSKEVGKQSSELRTTRIVRLYSMKGGV